MKTFHDITDPTVAKALAHPLRTRLLAALEDRTASPSELATEFDVPLGVLSYHIRRLTALGFLKLVRRVPRRGAVEHYYTATFQPSISNEAWRATPANVKRASLGAAIGQLGAQVSAAAGAGGFDGADSRLSRAPVIVDEQGWHELVKELEAVDQRVREIEARSQGRQGASDSDPQREANVVLMLFRPAPSDQG